MVHCFNTSVIRKTVMQFADDLYYCIGGKFGRGKFGKSSVIHQLKSSKLVVTINNPLADLFICQTSFHQNLHLSAFANHYCRQTFSPYNN